VISAISPGSLAETAGLRAGDRLLAINKHVLRDVIDVQFYGAEEELVLLIERAGQRKRIRAQRDYGEDLGLSFVNPTFDVDVRRCSNNCDFCFVKQNARGMRRSLYVKDDDYRYSFLFGNFVTLSNLTVEDWERLEEQRLSPLYVSVHATDVGLRRQFLRRETVPNVMDQLKRLADLGIEVHTQIVVVPGLNDGKHLAETVADLSCLYRAPVVSVGVVPIGLTKYHRGLCRTHTVGESRTVLDQVEEWQAENWEERACSFVHASDEWYLVAGRELPPAAAYDGFPQVENGIGMVRQLLAEAESWMASGGPALCHEVATLACGTLVEPVWARLVEVLNVETGASLRLVPVVNRFFGSVTTVSGLLTGGDVVSALHGRSLGDAVLLPRAMFTGRYGAGTASPGTTLDDMHISEIGRELGVRVEMAGTLGELLAALSG
jgi:putative radical SAM enzyme (TIGR03279 family)